MQNRWYKINWFQLLKVTERKFGPAYVREAIGVLN